MALASDVTTRVQSSLGDINKVRYPDAELIQYINDGQRLIVAVFPDANAVYGEHECAADSARQELATGWKLMKVHSNSDGVAETPSEGSFIPLTEIDLLDTMRSDWRSYAPAAAYRPTAADARYYTAYAHDPKEPAVFYLFPRPLDGYDVFLTASEMPAAVTAIANTLTLADKFVSTMTDYVIYRALLKEGRFAMDPALAQQYWEHFTRSLQAIVGSRKLEIPQNAKAPEGP